ncbi:MAG: tRNA (guanosine(46)-N7)-methyltransferase TrmB [Oscillospiraceae bacterium]|nr:tRNA (guanosine(46)-N7)-methyltransferase TrmB [Oscillospiraceae bacterium]
MTRLRKKKNISARLRACSAYWFEVPIMNRGSWRQACGMPENAPLYLELGCGKGRFAIETARRNPEICFIALEKEESVILAAIEAACEEGLTNLFFLCADVVLLKNYFATDEVDRIYINFCDPWSRKNKPKRRLTYREYLETYKLLLKPDGDIHFKTDDRLLFEFSLEEFEIAGLGIRDVTEDLHASRWNEDNIRTEFEDKFAGQGIAIRRAEAHKR